MREPIQAGAVAIQAKRNQLTLLHVAQQGRGAGKEGCRKHRGSDRVALPSSVAVSATQLPSGGSWLQSLSPPAGIGTGIQPALTQAGSLSLSA